METIDLKISAQTLNTIGAALRELPYRLSHPAIQEIEVQVQNHLKRKVKENEGSTGGTPPTGPSQDS